MIMTYSHDRFPNLIKFGHKIHTIREDKTGRWKAGLTIHHWMGNPRNIKSARRKLLTKGYGIIPHQFHENNCTEAEPVIIRRDAEFPLKFYVKVDNGSNQWQLLEPDEIRELAKNDGLTVEQFRLWFVPEKLPEFIGRIIHWTDKRYYTSP